MKFGVFGTGIVGATLGTAFVGLGHQVCIGSRSVPNESSDAWVSASGAGASAGSFADAAMFGDVLLNCTAGAHSLAALEAAGAKAMAGKILVDVANPLEFSDGVAPRLSVAGDDSLAEQIQRAYPKTLVVKALNTVTAAVMVDPSILAQPTDLFIAGDDADAKRLVTDLIVELGWSRDRVRDLGGIGAARASEMYLMLWIALMGALGSAQFNVRLVEHAE